MSQIGSNSPGGGAGFGGGNSSGGGLSNGVTPVVENCYCWTVTGADGTVTEGQFSAYGVVNSTGVFSRVVTSGTPAPAGATVQCATTKLLRQLIDEPFECPLETTTICGNTWVDCDGEPYHLLCAA